MSTSLYLLNCPIFYWMFVVVVCSCWNIESAPSTITSLIVRTRCSSSQNDEIHILATKIETLWFVDMNLSIFVSYYTKSLPFCLSAKSFFHREQELTNFWCEKGYSVSWISQQSWSSSPSTSLVLAKKIKSVVSEWALFCITLSSIFTI